MPELVYVTYEKDGYGGQQVEKIFTSRADAKNWIIASRFKNSTYYAGKEKHELKDLALNYIDEHKLIPDSSNNDQRRV